MTTLLTMLPILTYLGLVVFLSLMCFALRVGSLHQLQQVCRDRKRPQRINRILQSRQRALLAFELLLLLLLAIGGWVAAQLPSLQPFHFPTGGTGPEITAWVARMISVLALMTLLLVALPRSIARAKGGVLLYRCWGLLEAVRRVSSPLWELVGRFDRLVHRTAGVAEPKTRPGGELISEILTLVDEGQRLQAIWPGGSRMIHGLLDLHDTDVASIMTPRTRLEAISANTTLSEAVQQMMQSSYSRFPVTRDSIDDVIGVLYARDLLRSIADGRDIHTETVEGIARSAVYVPESQRIDALIDEMQEKKIQLAVVVDEYSGVAGVVTMEDIMEEIVGEISDEFDPDEPQLMHQQDGVIEADGSAHIDDLNDQYQLGLPEGADYDTLNGFLLAQFGRIPRQGESYHWQNVRLTVLEADERQLKRVRLEQLESSLKLTGSD